MGDVIALKPKITLTDVLRASIAARAGVGAGFTVGDFIAALRKLGVTDDMMLGSIEYGVAQSGDGTINIDVDQDGIAIREGR